MITTSTGIRHVCILTSHDHHKYITQIAPEHYALSPTIVAGISFDDKKYFDATFVFGVNTSAPGEYLCQQILRVRQVLSKQIYVLIVNRSAQRHKPTYYHGKIHWLALYQSGNLRFQELLTPDEVTGLYEDTLELDVVLDYLDRTWKSNNNLMGRLTLCAELQYLTVSRQIMVVEEDQEFEAFVSYLVDTGADEDDKKVQAIRRARLIEEDAYERLKASKINLTKDQTDEMIRYQLKRWAQLESLDHLQDYELKRLIKADQLKALEFEYLKGLGMRGTILNTEMFIQIKYTEEYASFKRNPLQMNVGSYKRVWLQCIACEMLKKIVTDKRTPRHFDVVASDCGDEHADLKFTKDVLEETLSNIYKTYIGQALVTLEELTDVELLEYQHKRTKKRQQDFIKELNKRFDREIHL